MSLLDKEVEIKMSNANLTADKVSVLSQGEILYAYNNVKIIADIMNRVGTDATAIKDELYKVKDYPGVGGLTSFDQNGDVIKPVIIKTVKNGQFVKYEE